MTVDLGALQAAAANGKAGLAVYQQQRDADTAAKDAALGMLLGHGYGSTIDTAGITSAVGQTHDRNLARLAGQETGATKRQDTLSWVPGYLQQHDALTARIGPWQANQAAQDAALHLYQNNQAGEAAQAFKADQAAKQQDFDKRMWNARFRLAHPGTTIV